MASMQIDDEDFRETDRLSVLVQNLVASSDLPFEQAAAIVFLAANQCIRDLCDETQLAALYETALDPMSEETVQ